MIEMKKYTVYLYRAEDCTRGWLSYLKLPNYTGCTLTVGVRAKNGADAKNKAITMANDEFNGLEIIKKWYTDSLWSLHHFPEIEKQLSQL